MILQPKGLTKSPCQKNTDLLLRKTAQHVKLQNILFPKEFWFVCRPQVTAVTAGKNGESPPVHATIQFVQIEMA